MSRETSVICDGCGAIAGERSAVKMGSGWSTVVITQELPGLLAGTKKTFDLCISCSNRVMPTAWPCFKEHVK